MSNRILLKTEGDPYIANIKPQVLNRCGTLLERIDDTEFQRATIAANINILRREAPYIFFFASDTTLEKWHSSQLMQRQPYLRTFASKQLQYGVWLTSPDLDFITTTVVTAVLLGDILPLATELADCENCMVGLSKPASLEDIDALFTQNKDMSDNLMRILGENGFLLSITDLRLLEVRTFNKNILQYFTS